MATVVTYNGVTLHNVATRDWHEEVIYDETHTDVVMHKFRARFDGIVSGGNTGPTYIAQPGKVNLPGLNPTADMRLVRQYLKVPRQTLTVAVGGQSLVFVNPAGNNAPDADVDNGPQPQAVTITQITGTLSYRVSFTIEWAKVECYEAGTAPPPFVLNNRWNVTESMNANGYTSRSIRGSLRLSRPDAGHVAKSLTVPLLEPGFRREAIEFAVDPTGLKCTYAVTDRQVHTAAPWPAKSFSAVYQLESDHGITWEASLSVRLEGAPNADKALLMLRALEITDARLKWETRRGKTFFPTHITIVEHIGEDNVVEMLTKGRCTAESEFNMKLALADSATFGKKLTLPSVAGEPSAYDAQTSIPPPMYGFDSQGGDRAPATLAMLACYYQNPCGGAHGVATGEPPSAQEPDPETGGNTTTITQTSETAIATESNDALNTGHHENIYTHATAESTYAMVHQRAQLPIARAATPNSTAATCSVVTLGPAIARRIIKVSCERVGKWPLIPAPVDTYNDYGPVGTLLSHKLTPMPPNISAAADRETLIYRIDAEYVYALNRPPTAAERIAVGRLPFIAFELFTGDVDGTEIYEPQLGPAPFST